MKISPIRCCLTLTALTGALALATAAQADPPSPPQEAFDACANAKEGDSCKVTMHGHDMEGTCATFPNKGLACRPNRPPGPPPEAFAACASAKEGDSCNVTFGSQTLKGTCEQAPGGQGLACRPEGGPPPPPSN